MTRETRLDLANLGQKQSWTIASLLISARGWMDIAKIARPKRRKDYKLVAFMYLNRAMEIEAGLTISGEHTNEASN